MLEVIVIKALHYSDCSLVVDFVGLHVAGEVVYHHQQLLDLWLPRHIHRHLQAYKVYVDQVHWFRHHDVTQRWLRILLLEYLALGTIQYASHHLCMHLWPPEPFLKKGISPVPALVSNITMAQVQGGLSFACWDNE